MKTDMFMGRAAGNFRPAVPGHVQCPSAGSHPSFPAGQTIKTGELNPDLREV